ncbi:effector-associated constant component EACC1 [Micromonospora sp. BQ11]|uniref:effector-associated constant component EACC1 n=1 Tax=Micromonospora sp. BQ11 TaxID=3452212 RepID=UPI003F89733A
MTGSAAGFPLELRAISDRFHSDDAEWLDQEAELVAGLRDVPDLAFASSDTTPAKGTTEAVIVALGSAGAFTATVEWVRAWLNRDRSRSIEITYTDDGGQKSLVVRSSGLREDTFRELLEAMRQRLEP